MRNKQKFRILNALESHLTYEIESWLNDNDIKIISIQFEKGMENWFRAYIIYEENQNGNK